MTTPKCRLDGILKIINKNVYITLHTIRRYNLNFLFINFLLHGFQFIISGGMLSLQKN